MSGWQSFWRSFLSPQTARFVLALLALGIASYALYGLMNQEVVESNREPLLLALGIILGLSSTAYGYYFGSTARGDAHPTDVRVTNPSNDPVPTTTEETP